MFQCQPLQPTLENDRQAGGRASISRLRFAAGFSGRSLRRATYPQHFAWLALDWESEMATALRRRAASDHVAHARDHQQDVDRACELPVRQPPVKHQAERGPKQGNRHEEQIAGVETDARVRSVPQADHRQGNDLHDENERLEHGALTRLVPAFHAAPDRHRGAGKADAASRHAAEPAVVASESVRQKKREPARLAFFVFALSSS